jgi:hypothetical protein
LLITFCENSIEDIFYEEWHNSISRSKDDHAQERSYEISPMRFEVRE